MMFYMKVENNRNLYFRIVASLLILLSVGLFVFSIVYIFLLTSEDIILPSVGLTLAGAFSIFEVVMILKGWKKENNLYKIAFNDNGNINNVPLVAVGLATAFGIGLSTLSLIVFFTREEPTIKVAMLVVMSISVYLLLNCIVYFIFLFWYRKKEFKIEDLIK